MAFTANSDLNVLQASDSANIGAGAGSDVYVITNGLLAENQQVQIIDSGANTIRLTSGLEIASSQVISNGFVLTLTNGAQITILESEGYTFEVGGDALTGEGATVQNFEQFVTQTLGLSQVPAGTTPVTGGPVTVGGAATPGVDKVFTLDEVVVTSEKFIYEGVELGAIEELMQYIEDYKTAIDAGGQNGDININYDGALALEAFDEGYLALMQDLVTNHDNYVTTTKTFVPATITATQNNAAVIESGFTSDANDLIVAGSPYSLHGAYIDGAGGYNTLEVDMKGPFAQPKQLLNIQEIKVQNLTNYYDVAGADYTNLFGNVFDAASDDSILDVSRASSLEKLVVSEAAAQGDLTVLGIKNYALASFQGSFDQDVTLHYNAGQSDALNLELVNVTTSGNIVVAHNTGKVVLDSEGYSNNLTHVDLGSHLQELVVTGDAMLNIDGGLNFAFGAAHIDASENTGGIRLNVGTVTAGLEDVNITGSQGNDVIEVSGTANGVLLNIDTNIGNDTVVLDGVDAGAGSALTGENLTVEVATDSDLAKTTISGVNSFVMAAAATLTISQAQAADIAAKVSAAHDVTDATLKIEVTSDTTLSDLVALADLDSNIQLELDVAQGATLTLTAEQLDLYVAAGGIQMSNTDGALVITDAGLNFVIAPEVTDANGTGVTVIRTQDGYERYEEPGSTDTMTIDSTGDAPLEIDGIDGTQITTLQILGDQDVNFTDTVTLANPFEVDFSELSGSLNGLEITNFEDVSSVTGNGVADTRIDVQLDGDVGTAGAANGLESSGVAQYVVTEMNDGDHTFYVCDKTQDLEVIGLQGNQTDTLTIGNVPWGAVNPTILLEGDGYANWDELPKAAGNPDASNVGTIDAQYFYDGAPANVLITNQGVAPGLTSTGEARPIVVDGITLDNAKSLNITIEDGDALISSIADGGSGAGLETVALNSANNVTLVLDGDSLDAIDASGVTGTTTLSLTANTDLSDTTLTDVDAIVLDDNVEVTLTIDQIDAIGVANITHGAFDDTNDEAVLNVAGLDEDPFSMPASSAGIELGSVTIAEEPSVTLDAATDLTGATEVIIPEDTTVTMTAAQFMQFAEYDVDGDVTASPDVSGAGNLVITDLTQALVDAGFSLDNVASTGSVELKLAEDVVLDDSVAHTGNATDLGDASIELATGQTINFATVEQASAREVTVETGATNTTVEYAFTAAADGDHTTGFDIDGDGTIGDGAAVEAGDEETAIDTSNYSSDLTTLKVKSQLVEDENVEQVLAGLHSNITVDIFTPAVGTIEVNGTNRIVVAEEDAVVDGDLEFDDLQGNVRVETLDLTLQGNVVIDGSIDVAEATTAIVGFEKLTINSEGATVNTIGDSATNNGDIFATGNDLLDVEINADQDLVINGTVTFTKYGFADTGTPGDEDAAEATLTLNGTGDITIASLDVTDTDVDTLNIVNNSTGTVNVPGASPSLTMEDALGDDDATDASNLVLSGSGDFVFGSAIDEDDWVNPNVPEFKAGIHSSDLSSIDASALTGDLDLGIVQVDVAADETFTVTGGTGVTTLTLGDSNDPDGSSPFTMNAQADVTIDLSNGAAGSAVTLTADAVLPNMTGEAAADAGSLTINTGANGKLLVEGAVDLTQLVDTDGNNKLDLSNVETIELAEGGALKLTDAQWDDLTPAQQAAIEGAGQALVINADNLTDFTDDGTATGVIDLTEFRGITSVQIAQDLANNNTLLVTHEQAAVITSGTFDANGVFTAGTWDDDNDAGTAEVDVTAGNFTNMDTVQVVVTGDADLSDLIAVDEIDISNEADTYSDLTISNTQLAALDNGDNDIAAELSDQLNNLTLSVEVQTGQDPVSGDPQFTDLDVDVTQARDTDGLVTDSSATGHGGAIARAQAVQVGSEVDDLLDAMDTVEFTTVGSEISAVQGGNSVTMTASNAVDTFTFISEPTDDGFAIADFSTSDVLDVSALFAGAYTFATAASDDENATGPETDISDQVFLLTDHNQTSISVTDFTNTASGGQFADATTKALVIVQDENNHEDGYVYLVDASNGGADNALVDDAGDIVLLGTIDAGNGHWETDYAGANFGL